MRYKVIWLLNLLLLTHWGRVTHICVGNLTIIGPDNGLSPGRHQAIIWTNARILLIGPWGRNLNEILIGIHTFSFKKINLNMSSAKWRPFCLGLNVLNKIWIQPGVVITQSNITWHCIMFWLYLFSWSVFMIMYSAHNTWVHLTVARIMQNLSIWT